MKRYVFSGRRKKRENVISCCYIYYHRRRQMNFKKGNLMALTVAVLMGMSTFTSVSADEGQTNTTFTKGELNGIPGTTLTNDFSKYHVWDSTKNAYVFTKDSLIKTNEGIFAQEKSIKIMAKGVTLTMIPQKFKNRNGHHGNLGGIQINVDREYKAREGTHLPAGDVSPDIGIDIEVGKFVIDIDPNKNASIKNKGIYYDTYGIASVSRGGNKVNIKGDVDVTVKNGYRAERGSTFTGGITTMHQGHINIDGNAKVTVDVENGHNLPHYLVNGIFAGMNYTPDKYGSDINITGNVDVKSNGTGIQAGGSSFLTIGGGGTVTIDKKTQHYSLLAEEGFISMNVKLNRLSEGRTDEMPKVESVGNAVTKIYGDVKFNNHESRPATNSGLAPSIINLALTTSDSRLEGVVIDDFKEEPTADPKKQWARSLTGLNLYLQNGAVWKNEMWGNHQSSFTGSKVRSIIGGDDIKKAGIIEQNDSGDITVNSFEKHIKVIYQQGKDNPNFFKGGAIHIKSAKENSSITLRTNLKDFKMPGQGGSNVYDAALNALAGKLYYEGKDGHLTGKVEVAESLMAEAWGGKISFKANGQGELKAGTASRQDSNSETSAMKGIRSAMVSTGMISTGAFWSAQNNDVERRMGDIRLARTETGLWAKYQGGNSEYNDTDSREKAVYVDQRYNAIQVGYDKSVGDWIVGGTFSYGTTKDKYIDNRDTGKLNGTGKETGFNGGVYGTLKQKDGSYFDIIAKVGQIKNNYEVYTKDWDKDKKNDDKVNSEYKVNGTSLSVEYGKRIEREGFYVEPSMELTVNRVAGHSEEVTSEVHKYKMKITQDDMTSVVGRIGVGIGQNCENGHIYGKVSLAHEFNGDIMTTFSAGNKEEVVKLSLRGTWLDVEMGGSYRLSKDSYFYGSFTKNFGAKLNNKWRLDAGIRLAF